MQKIYERIDPSSLLRRPDGKVDWFTSYPMIEGENASSWRNRLKCVRSAFAYQRAIMDSDRKDSRNRTAREWKRLNNERCKANGAKWYDNNRAHVLLRAAKERAKKKGLTFTVSLGRVKSALIVGVCEATGLALDISHSRKSAFSPSLDRVKLTEGYTDENTMVVCWGYNAAKNLFRVEDFIAVAECVAKNKDRILERHRQTP